MFFYLIKLLFSGFLPFKGNIVCGKKMTQNTVIELLLYENEHVGRIHFHKNGFALRLVLTERQKTTRNDLFERPKQIRNKRLF